MLGKPEDEGARPGSTISPFATAERSAARMTLERESQMFLPCIVIRMLWFRLVPTFVGHTATW